MVEASNTQSPKAINSGFSIEGLTLMQDKCALKIGTDSVLLGRWARGTYSDEGCATPRFLDIGTGTGILALLMAVRFPSAKITAIDIDEAASLQASENVSRNSLQDRVSVLHTSLQQFAEQQAEQTFDCIICNPPYFQNSLKCPDSQRTLARHTDSLSFHDLFSFAARLLSSHGTFSLIIPAEAKSTIDYEAALAALFPSRITAVKTSPKKPVRRYLLEFTKQPHKIEAQSVVTI